MKENCGGKNYGCFACTAQLARVQEEHRYNQQQHQERKGKEERELKQNDCIHSVRCEQSSPIICLVIEVIKRCGSHEGRACCYLRACWKYLPACWTWIPVPPLAAQKADTFLWRNSIICVVTCPPATPLLSVASNKNEDLHLKFFFFFKTMTTPL